MEPHTWPVTLNATGMAMLPVMALLGIIQAGTETTAPTVSIQAALVVATGAAAEIKSLLSVAVEYEL